jgi:signal transduction histidine kinase
VKVASLPPDEAARLALLCALNILDSAPEEAFDRITRLASTLLKTPIAAVSLMDEHRGWYKSRQGLEVSETPRSLAFCAYVIQQREMLLVPDTRRDERFANSPLVRGERGLRFYAGAPLHSADGVALGTLCIMGHEPRELAPEEAQVLADLAEIVSRELMVRELALRSGDALIFRLELDQDGRSRFTHACDGIAALAGLTLDELLADAMSLLRQVHPEDRGRLLQLLRQPPVEGNARIRFRLLHARLGKQLWCEARANVRYGLRGCIVWSGCLSDVTQQVEAENQWREHDRLRVTAVLATGVAHDVNNLLGSMMGLAELCRDQAEAGSRQRRNLQRILDSGEKAARLTRQLLDFARQSAPVLQTTRLGVLVAEAAPLLRVALPAGVDLALEVAPGQDEPVAVDRGQMEQVLHNLVRNAGHAMKERGGTVRIRVEARAASHSPLQERSLVLTVLDSGCGIPAAHLAQVFEPFFTTKPVGEGSGLGLSSCHGIVTSHGGQIVAHSTVDVGSAFEVWLPVCEGVEAEEGTAATA